MVERWVDWQVDTWGVMWVVSKDACLDETLVASKVASMVETRASLMAEH